MIKIKNKFNIGDIVYVAGFSDEDKSRYSIVRFDFIIGEDMETFIHYGVRSLDGRYNNYVYCRCFMENELFWTYEECINRKDSGAIRRTATHLENILQRIFRLIVLFSFSIPFLVIQFIHWLFTGRKESKTYYLMSKLTGDL